MTSYKWKIYHGEILIGEIITGHYVTNEEALKLLGAEEIPGEKNAPDDPDYTYNGQPLWYDDIEVVLE